MAVILAALIACPPAHGLVSIDDGKNQLYITAGANFAWDSNIFASSSSSGDFIYSASLSLDFKRRAGLIGINGSVGIDASQFGKFKGESFQNPHFRAELTKASGRTTGSLTLGAARQSRADTAANLRNESWNYDTGINFKYPVIERYSISGSLNYSLLDYIDNTLFVDLRTYSASVDLYYVYTTERDLMAGYRIRYGETSSNTSFYDHAFTAGISGKILPKVGGSLRVGYQIRQPRGTTEGDYKALTASAATTWNASKRIAVATQISKDFSTSSTNINIDATSINTDFRYALSAKMLFFTGLGYGTNRFLGAAGGGRRDTFFTWDIGGNYTMSDHLKVSLSYAYYQNWSSVNFGDFTRNSINLNLSSTF